MKLVLLSPAQVVVDAPVVKIVAEGEHGSFCLLPRHVDFLASLVPGLLAFVDEAGAERFVAIDEGVLVKRGSEVLVSTLQAVVGENLEKLRFTVHDEFETLDDHERAARTASAQLEASFMRSYLELIEEM